MHPAGQTDTPQQEVRRRIVFYVPGYDPFPPRRYRELYRTEAAEQARIAGHVISVRPAGRAGWRIEARIDGQNVETMVEVLVWSDIVQQSMGQGILSTYAQLTRTAWTYVSSGALFRLMRLRRGPVLAALYPIVFLLLQLIAALALGWGLAGFLAMPLAGMPIHWALMSLIILSFATTVLFLSRRYDRRFFAWYLMHDYAFTACESGAYPRNLEGRIAEFVDRIRSATNGDWDEVLVVGHSSGAHLAISALADFFRSSDLAPHVPVGFLSLGNVVPMVSFLPRADRLRRDLADLSAETRVSWIDVSAPGDVCSFALCDPVAVSGMARPDSKWPLVLSAAFTRSLTSKRWKQLRWRFFRLHFQYLCAFDRPASYDYFAITAGPVTLRSRFARRTPSKTRLVQPVNRFGLVR